MQEYVVLVDENNNPTGASLKNSVHSFSTPLHRGFSVFLFNRENKLLVTRRSKQKKTFPGILTNSFCGHPFLDESVEMAAKRRVKEELGITDINILKTIPYRYKAVDINGIEENEICPVMIATTDSQPVLNLEEVEEMEWVPWDEFLLRIKKTPTEYSLWSREEALLIDKEIGVIINR